MTVSGLLLFGAGHPIRAGSRSILGDFGRFLAFLSVLCLRERFRDVDAVSGISAVFPPNFGFRTFTRMAGAEKE